jgi:hypothetical protein
MGRRSDIDWEAIERDYRIGQLSLRQIAAKHEVAVSSIVKRQKNEKWSRDLSAQVRVQTKAELIRLAAEKAHENATQSVHSDALSVQAAAHNNVEIISGHRRDIQKEAERTRKLAEKIDTLMDKTVEAKEVALLASTHESLVRSRARLIGLEREAYGIGEAEPPPDDEKLIDLGRAEELRSKIRGQQ